MTDTFAEENPESLMQYIFSEKQTSVRASVSAELYSQSVTSRSFCNRQNENCLLGGMSKETIAKKMCL